MPERITVRNLRALAHAINRETRSPESYFDETGPDRRINIGHYHVDIAYGGYAIERTVNDAGGISVVIGRGTARDVFERMHAWLDGYRQGRADEAKREHSHRIAEREASVATDRTSTD